MIIPIAPKDLLAELGDDSLFKPVDTSYTPWKDVAIILLLIRRHNCRSLLEIGTNLGHTARAVKVNYPDIAITTIDPGDKIPSPERPAIQNGEYPRQEDIGILLKPYQDVQVIKEKLEDIDFGDKKFDCIFIDGDHSRREVTKDTNRALSLIAPGGVLIWHDVSNSASATAALDAFNFHILHPTGTWIGFCCTPSDDAAKAF